MSDNKPNIAQIRKYLNGELSARAMFELERQAQTDPFLWDAIKGMESGGEEDHQSNLHAIDQLINQRVEQEKRRIIPMWKIASIAASLLIGLSVGGWLLFHGPQSKPNADQIASNVKVELADTAKIGYDKVEHFTPSKSDKITNTLARSKALPTPELLSSPQKKESVVYGSTAPPTLASVNVKTDTVEYKASAYPVNAKANVNDLLKKLPGIDVDAKGNVTSQGQQVTKVRLNGKDFNGGDVKNAIKNLPADVIDKIQVVDDYGDQANKTGIKTGEPAKILNIASKKPATPDELLKKLAAMDLDSTHIVAAEGKAYRATAKGKTDTTKLNKTLIAKADGVQVTSPDRHAMNAYPQLMINGHVIDEGSHEALPGVSVKVEGSKVAAQTDAYGNFNIAVPADKETLSIGYLGYNTKQIKVKGVDSLSVSLKPNGAALSEVSIANYSAKSKQTLLIENAHPIIGWTAYNEYLAKGATTSGQTGVVKLSFTVGVSGIINDIKVVKGLTGEADLKAIKLVKNGSLWAAAADGKAHQINLDIVFHK